MPRQARLVNSGESTVYHVISRSTIPGFCIGDVEKDFFVDLLRMYSSRYFAEILGFCVMGNHFHLAIHMFSGDRYSDEEIKRRFIEVYGKDKSILDCDVSFYSLNSRVNVTMQAGRRPIWRRGPSVAWLFHRPAIVCPVPQNIQ